MVLLLFCKLYSIIGYDNTRVFLSFLIFFFPSHAFPSLITLAFLTKHLNSSFAPKPEGPCKLLAMAHANISSPKGQKKKPSRQRVPRSAELASAEGFAHAHTHA